MGGRARLFHGARGDYALIGPVAYQGKQGCRDVTCTQRGNPDGCAGWHCVYCDEPCSSQGHRCPASDAILGEAERISRELELGDGGDR